MTTALSRVAWKRIPYQVISDPNGGWHMKCGAAQWTDDMLPLVCYRCGQSGKLVSLFYATSGGAPPAKTCYHVACIPPNKWHRARKLAGSLPAWDWLVPPSLNTEHGDASLSDITHEHYETSSPAPNGAPC